MTSLTDSHTFETCAFHGPIPYGTPETDDTAYSESQTLHCTSIAPNLPDLFARFLDNYIPREKFKSQDGQKAQVSWLQAIRPSHQSDASLDLAILALSLACLGRKHGDERLRREGTANYGRALHRLQGILSNHNLLFEEETLASCMTLSTFEVSTPEEHEEILRLSLTK